MANWILANKRHRMFHVAAVANARIDIDDAYLFSLPINLPLIVQWPYGGLIGYRTGHDGHQYRAIRFLRSAQPPAKSGVLQLFEPTGRPN
jgi:hypothetical protein